MNEPVFVIMAAGMGSRFGGLKQITPVDDQGQKIMDYSLYDARRAGFRKVVLIIKKAIEKEFRATIGKQLEQKFDVRYAYQELDKLPEGFTVPEGRTKPWGTAHAVACAQDVIDGPFAVLNADDYYGASAIRAIYEFLREPREAGKYAMVGYLVRNTVSEVGAVARGICDVKDGYLQNVVEQTRIEKRGQDAAYTEDGINYIQIPGDTIVSMNLWGFQQEFIQELLNRFPLFLRDNLEKNPLKCEYYLPTVANQLIHEHRGSVRVLSTDDVWHGITYAEDLQALKSAIMQMRLSGQYPERLWD